jgi:hypothetical protein
LVLDAVGVALDIPVSAGSSRSAVTAGFRRITLSNVSAAPRVLISMEFDSQVVLTG